MTGKISGLVRHACDSCCLRGAVAGAPGVGLSRCTVAQQRDVPATLSPTSSTDLPAHKSSKICLSMSLDEHGKDVHSQDYPSELILGMLSEWA